MFKIKLPNMNRTLEDIMSPNAIMQTLSDQSVNMYSESPMDQDWISNSSDAVTIFRSGRQALDSHVGAPSRHISITTEVVMTVCYAVGIFGNLAALVILISGGRKAHRNRRHALMLRCLASNDLVALLGMLAMMEAQLWMPRELSNSRWFCALRVVWRLFGLGSGSVALVMAVERWLALTRPFLYQKRVTYRTIRRAIFSLWGCVLLLVILPLFGFGLYYDPAKSKCARYRNATHPIDVAYAYLYFAFGIVLIACILTCNIMVMRQLRHAGQVACSKARPSGQEMLTRVLRRSTSATVKITLPPSPGRRFSRSSSRISKLQHSESIDSATYEETAFAKLMALLCVLFVLCWLPQIMTIPLTQLWSDWGPGKKFTRVADFSLLLHFTLDPFVYVLQRCTRRRRATASVPGVNNHSNSNQTSDVPYSSGASQFFWRCCFCSSWSRTQVKTDNTSNNQEPLCKLGGRLSPHTAAAV